jgi:hypothetical protein
LYYLFNLWIYNYFKTSTHREREREMDRVRDTETDRESKSYKAFGSMTGIVFTAKELTS